MQRENEMTCQELVEVITDYLEGALSAAERERFETHLDECPGCVAYLDQMRTVIVKLQRLDEDALPAAARDELLWAFRDWCRDRT
jgi:anti-sigma factor RsiW